MMQKLDGEYLPSSEIISFGSWRLCPRRRWLERDGVRLELGDRALDILIVLVERAGEVVTNNELLEQVWRGVTVSDGSVRFQIAMLRKALNDFPSDVKYIENVPGRGYRFVGFISRSTPPETAHLSHEPRARGRFAVRLARMVGRDQDVAAISRKIIDQRFVTIIGPGGIGKTTVAVAASQVLVQSFDLAVHFVDFSALRNPQLVASTVASLFGLQAMSGDPTSFLINYLRHKRMLIVFDCCEHLIDAAASLTEKIFRSAPDVHLLATSRESLRVEGEHAHRLQPLDVPPPKADISAQEAMAFPAVELFVERAAASSGGFELNGVVAPLVAEICRFLDGIPLAIELAAARTGVMSVAAIVTSLKDLFSLLAGGQRTALPRHQTLRATLDWSHELLPPNEQIILRRLGIFRGSFELNSAVTVGSEDALPVSEVKSGIGNLVAKSLLTANASRDIVYYKMLDTMRAYAREKVADSGEASEIARRHAFLYADLFRNAEADWDVGPKEKFLELYAGRIDDLRAALDWAFSSEGDVSVGIKSTADSRPVWFALSLVEEYRGHAERALKHLKEASLVGSEQEMRLSLSLGLAIYNAWGPVPSMAAAAARALEIAERLGATTYRVRALWQLARERANNGDYAGLLALCKRFDELAQTIADDAISLVRDRMTGLGVHLVGRQAEARVYAERAFNHPSASMHSTQTTLKDYDNRIASRALLARVLWFQGFPDRAAALAAESVECSLRLGDALPACYVLADPACPIAFWIGNRSEIARYLRLLREQSTNLPFGLWHSWLGYYEKVAALGENDGTSAFQDRSNAIIDELKGPIIDMIGTFREELTCPEAVARTAAGITGCYAPEILRAEGANLLRRRGQQMAEKAEALFKRSLDLARQQGALSWELRSATSLARLWQKQGRSDRARALLAPVYEQFSEGFATADLLAAKNTLDDRPPI